MQDTGTCWTQHPLDFLWKKWPESITDSVHRLLEATKKVGEGLIFLSYVTIRLLVGNKKQKEKHLIHVKSNIQYLSQSPPVKILYLLSCPSSCSLSDETQDSENLNSHVEKLWIKLLTNIKIKKCFLSFKRKLHREDSGKWSVKVQAKLCSKRTKFLSHVSELNFWNLWAMSHTCSFLHRTIKINVLSKLSRFSFLQFFKYFIHIKTDDFIM